MESINWWLIGPISKPNLIWGNQRQGHIHECPVCHVSLLTGEKPGFCCGPNGSKYRDVPPLPPLPSEFNTFLNHPHISRLSRVLNLLYSFASLETTDTFPNLEGGPAFIAIQGKVYHRIRPSHTTSAVRWFLHDGHLQDAAPTHPLSTTIPNDWKDAFTTALLRINPFARALQNLSSMSQTMPNVRLLLRDDGTTPEIAAVMSFGNTTTGQQQTRQMVIQKKNGRNQSISSTSRMWEPLAYPLFFPSGTLGWGLPQFFQHDSTTQSSTHNSDIPTTQMWHYRARLLREPRFQIFGRLTNEYLVDMFSRDLECRLRYIRTNQERIRVDDAVLMGAPDVEPTENIYLPASFLGSRRWASEQIADALAVASRRGQPTFFITMTCNPEWPEITSQLQAGQNFADIPIVVVRVFKQKLALLLKSLKTMFTNVGRPIYTMYSIEFQKRGLPHAHILLKFPHDCLHPQDIDAIISAEIPDNIADAALVRKFMLHHHPSSSAEPSKYCQRITSDGTRYCRFHYPHTLQDTTTIDEDGRVHYKRRHESDDMVVPHCLPLLRRFRCHINFEIAGAAHIFQYLFKYVYKGTYHRLFPLTFPVTFSTHSGPDMTKCRFLREDEEPQEIDEIEEYWKARYLSATEAAWRIMGFHVTKKDPAVTALAVHLPESHSRTQYSRRNGTESHLSLLDRYFLRPQTTVLLNDIQQSFENLTYCDYYENFRLAPYNATLDNHPNYFRELENDDNSSRMHVIKRKPNQGHVARLPSLTPSKGDVFYLRTLLQHFPFRSFIDARTVNGITFTSFQEAATKRGLFLDHDEASLAMLEATTALHTPHQLRYLFVDLLVNDCTTTPFLLWQDFTNHLSKDFVLQHHNDIQLAIYFTLRNLQCLLQDHDKSLSMYGLPQPAEKDIETIAEVM